MSCKINISYIDEIVTLILLQTSKAWTDTTQYLSSWMSPKPAVKTDDAVSKDDAVNSNEALSPDNKPSNNNEKQASLDAEPK